MGSRDDAHDHVVILESAAPHAIEWAAERLADGGVIAMPTDTVYGIAASLSFPSAIRRIFAVKSRPDSNPMPILVSSTGMLDHLAANVPPDVLLLLDRFWPGPLTVVVPAKSNIPAEMLAGGTTVGLRMPNHPLAIEVIAKCGGAIACTSANRSGDVPALDAATVADSIGPDLDLILDGGIAPGGVASTVVEFRGDDLIIHREGAIAEAVILEAWTTLRSGRNPGTRSGAPKPGIDSNG